MFNDGSLMSVVNFTFADGHRTTQQPQTKKHCQVEFHSRRASNSCELHKTRTHSGRSKIFLLKHCGRLAVPQLHILCISRKITPLGQTDPLRALQQVSDPQMVSQEQGPGKDGHTFVKSRAACSATSLLHGKLQR